MPTYVRSFDDFAPPARFDSVAFTIARIQESADGATWATIESIALEADADPSEPQLRDLTTDQATLEAGYYRILWEDADGHQFASGVVRFPASVALPTLEELRRQVNTPEGHNDELLTAKLAAAVAFARDRTGRQFDLLDAEDEPVELTRRPRGSRFVRVPDAREVTTVELDGVEAAADEYTTHESNGFITVLELCARPAEVVVTGKFGMAPAFPDDLREAILEEAANRYYDRETGNSDSAASDEYGPASFSRPPGWARAVFKSYRVPSDDFALA